MHPVGYLNKILKSCLSAILIAGCPDSIVHDGDLWSDSGADNRSCEIKSNELQTIDMFLIGRLPLKAKCQRRPSGAQEAAHYCASDIRDLKSVKLRVAHSRSDA